jgi:hypothetical protein
MQWYAGSPHKEKKKEEEMVVENESQSQEIGEKLTEEKEGINNKVAVDMMQKVADETEREEEEREEELVDFEDSQDKLGDQEEDDVLESQESFTTKVNKITVVSKTSEELIVVKIEHEKTKSKVTLEEPRRCSRLKEQEDADRTELAMKRTARKNEILGNETTLTVLNSSDEVLDMNNKLGVVSSKGGEDYSIVSVIKNLESTRKIVYDESMKNKELAPPNNLDMFTQVT